VIRDSLAARQPRSGLRLPGPARLAVLAIGLAWGLLAEAVRLRANWPLGWVLVDLLPGAAFLVCGSVAWDRRPSSRIGPLMLAVGYAWFAGTVAASAVPLVDRTAYAVQGYYDAFLAWLILAYPSGRLRWLASRLVVGLFFTVLLVRTIFRFAVFQWTGGLDVADPSAVERYIAGVTLRDQGDALFRVLIAGISIAVLALIVARWRAGSPAGRAVAGPILLGGIGFATGIIVETIGLALAADSVGRSAAWDLAQWATVITASVIPIAFVVGLGQERVARGRVGDLVVELGSAPAAGDDLQAALARALGDPSLIVAYPVPGTDAFADLDGRPVAATRTEGDRATTAVTRGGRTLAMLVHDPALAERSALLSSVAAAAGLVVENEALQAEVRAQLEEVRASRARIVAAGDEERRRVERDLHDGAQQRLVSLALALQIARRQAAEGDPAVEVTLDRVADELELALAELRELARGIHPSVLVEEGIAAAVRALAERAPIRVTVDATSARYPAPIESAAYFVVAEALTNVARYAGATLASVRVHETDGMLVVEVRDDGVGGARMTAGSGLRGLDDRVASIGGRLSIDSPIGRGTTVRAEIPCASS
jgi:signal transduction histidine kinase